MAIDRKVIKNPSQEFLEELIEYAKEFFGDDCERFRACIQCGTCTGGCPSARRTAWRTRMVFRKAQMGLREEALGGAELWDCTTCYTCQERCVRGIPTTDFVRAIRNVAFKSGVNLQPAHLFVAGLLEKFGHAVPVNDPTKAVRKRIGLQETPPTVHSHPEGLEEVKTLLKETGFKETLDNNIKKKEEEKKAQEAKK
ncbi:MAG: CoB--CoM heterodisulfide reductase subunit C [Candidatus Helarchaeota archaeon]